MNAVICTLKDIDDLAYLIGEIDMANAGIGKSDIKDSIEKSYDLLEKMAGSFSKSIFGEDG